MKTRVYVIALLVISATLLIVSNSSTFVFADACTASLSYPVLPQQFSNTNVPFVVPVSASCTTYYGNQLYATGNAYDVSSNTALGSASTILSPVSGGAQFNGQLSFNVPPTSSGDTVQISASIYDSQGGNLITATGETVQVGGGVPQTIVQVTTTTVTQGQYPYANPAPISYPSPYQQNQHPYYQTQPQNQYQQQGHPSHPTNYYSQGYWQRSNNAYLFDYVAILVIIAAVIIATVGLVLAARKQQPPQPVWYPVPPPPPR
jgi:hypothetical protein